MPDLSTDLRDYLDAVVAPLVDVSEPGPYGSTEELGPRRRWSLLATAAVSVAAATVFLVGMLMVSDDGPEDVRIVDEPTETTLASTTSSTVPFEEAIIEPSDDLVDGQTVSFVADFSGTANMAGIAQCASEVLTGGTVGTWCDLNTEVDWPGTGAATVTVKRTIDTDQGPIDCGERPSRCLIGMQVGSAGDATFSAGPISFRSDAGPTTTNADSRHAPATAWTGERYLVWGGEAEAGRDLRNDGWALDPRTGEVTSIPPAPIDGRFGAAGVWTGDELIVCCGTANSDDPDVGTAAAYDPAAGTWRRIADPPGVLTDRTTLEVSRYALAAWTGDEMLVVSGDYSVETFVAGYDPDTDRWRTIGGAPSGIGRQSQFVWTGEELIVWDRGNRGLDPDSGHRYQPSLDRWTDLPELPDAFGIDEASIAWTGDQLVVWGGAGATWRPGDASWETLPDPGLPPIDWYEGTPGSQSIVWDSVRERILLWPTHGGEWGSTADGTPGPIPLMSYNPASQTWERLDEHTLGYAPQLTSADGWLLWPRLPPVLLEPPG